MFLKLLVGILREGLFIYECIRYMPEASGRLVLELRLGERELEDLECCVREYSLVILTASPFQRKAY